MKKSSKSRGKMTETATKTRATSTAMRCKGETSKKMAVAFTAFCISLLDILSVVGCRLTLVSPFSLCVSVCVILVSLFNGCA